MDEKIIRKNKELIEKYPWLWPKDWFGNPIPTDKFDYSSTTLDDFPEGWKKAFGEKMCEEIQTALIKHQCVDRFTILQLKEKYGAMRLYFGGLPRACQDEIHAIVMKYEELSAKTCCICGKPAKWMSKGWICPYCDECAQNLLDDKISKGYIDSNTTIDKAFSPIESSD